MPQRNRPARRQPADTVRRVSPQSQPGQIRPGPGNHSGPAPTWWPTRLPWAFYLWQRRRSRGWRWLDLGQRHLRQPNRPGISEWPTRQSPICESAPPPQPL